jgi:hypothetical protein
MAASSNRVRAPISIVRTSIAERYWKDNPTIGPGITKWIHSLADELGIDHGTVERVVAEEREMHLMVIRGQQASKAEELALLTGATVTKALATFAQAMDANDDHIVKDSRGNVQVYPEGHEKAGEPMVHSQPNWPARIRGAENAIKVTIGWAATKVEIEEHRVIENLSEMELAKQIAAARDRLGKYIPAATPDGTGQDPSTRGGGKRQISDPRPMALVDGVYQDDGRAGQGGAV